MVIIYVVDVVVCSFYIENSSIRYDEITIILGLIMPQILGPDSNVLEDHIATA